MSACQVAATGRRRPARREKEKEGSVTVGKEMKRVRGGMAPGNICQEPQGKEGGRK